MGDETNPMKPTSPEQAVFAEALARTTPEARAAYLDAACGSDDALRRRVEVLLRASESAGDFLEEPPTGLDSKETLVLNLPFSEKPGDKIGRYKLLQQIGEGGCGVVYMAEQLEPVRRRVALKVIKLGMDTKSVIARFEAERQALALMDHPNIAKVLDAGATETGRPYFVMELVRGIKITDYCDANNLSTGERLKLFMQVCQAIQHAHQKGIIHRDIKPSNILVTISEPNSPGCPKVIDFGIAKATTDQRLTDKTVFTAFEQFIGTPAYMSPEQAMMTSLDIDTRTDIYALGVLLYELLTGKTPFDANELMAVGLDAMRRMIHEQEPARPSTRLSTMLAADLTSVAKHRHSEPAKLGTLLRGDLDWIVMKALEKDRTRRYETANGLAMDLQRHLNNEPVTARPPSAAYRLQKMVRRNKAAVAVAITLLLSLLLGLVGTTSMYLKAQAAQKKAASEAAIAAAVNEFLQEDILKQSRSGINYRWRENFDAPPTLLQALDRADKAVANRFKEQPLVEAAIQHTIGAAYANMNRATLAVPHLQRALLLRQSVLGKEDSTTLGTAQELGAALSYANDFTNALEILEEYLPLQEKAWGKDDLRTLANRAELAVTHVKADPSAQNLAALRDMIKLMKDKAMTDNSTYMECVFWLAETYQEQNQPLEAIPLQKELIAFIKTKYGPEHPTVIQDLGWLAASYGNAGKSAEQIDALKETVEISRKYYGETNLWTLSVQSDLAEALAKSGRGVEALAMFQNILTAQEATLPPAHRLALRSRQKLGWCYDQLGAHTQQASQTEKGIKILEAVLPLQMMTLGPDELDTQFTMGDLAFGYQDVGRQEDAVPLLEKNFEFQKKRNGLEHTLAQFILQRLITAYEKTGRTAKADALRPLVRVVKDANK